MTTEIDSGFLAPFRGNIIYSDSDGIVKVKLPPGLIFDHEMINKYFDDPVISWERGGFKIFTGKAKTKELANKLRLMSYETTINLPPGWK